MPDYNATVLDGELKAAGLLVAGCNSSGVVFWIGKPSPADLDLAEQVKAAHDPLAKTPKELQLEQRRAYIASLVADLEAGTAGSLQVQRALATLIKRELGV